MKRNKWQLLLIPVLAAVLFFSIPGFRIPRTAPAPGTPQDGFTEYLSRRVTDLMHIYDVPGVSIALVRDGSPAWAGAFGTADRETGRQLTPDTPMRVQSISKPVTAWGILRLVDTGRISLDQPVASCLTSWSFPDSAFDSEGITVRQLLSHTSGLPLGDVFTIYPPGSAMPTLRERLTEEAVPRMAPGTAFSYSNTGFNLLELLIEDVTGSNFDVFMREEILIPSGMTGATFTLDPDVDPAVPTGYGLTGRPVPAYVYPEKASGGLIATASDIARFAAAGMPGQTGSVPVVSDAALQEIRTPEADRMGVYSLVFDAYGLGHYLEDLGEAGTAWSHGGQGTGIMTHVHAVPETGDALVILTNSQRSWPLISYLAGDWAAWRGLPQLGMERIVWGTVALRTVISAAGALILYRILTVVQSIRTGRRHLTLRRGRRIPGRRIRLAAAVGLSGLLVWAATRPYLFLTSVFPLLSGWFAVTGAALAALLLLEALFPPAEPDPASASEGAA